jgi:hypothetical protein
MLLRDGYLHQWEYILPIASESRAAGSSPSTVGCCDRDGRNYKPSIATGAARSEVTVEERFSPARFAAISGELTHR